MVVVGWISAEAEQTPCPTTLFGEVAHTKDHKNETKILEEAQAGIVLIPKSTRSQGLKQDHESSMKICPFHAFSLFDF